MNFMFEGQEQYLTSERSERVRYCSCHMETKQKAKGGNRDIQKIRHSGPG